jgi:hypothetical protein
MRAYTLPASPPARVPPAAFWNEQVRDNLNSLVAAGTALPSSAVDGESFYYVADATNGIVWHLRYRAASASAYKWEYVGGDSLQALVDTAQNTISTSFTDLATAGPQITLPLAGDYLCDMNLVLYNNGSNFTFAAVKFGAATTLEADGLLKFGPNAATHGKTIVKTGLAAAAVAKLQYKVGAGTGTFQTRILRVRPIRVG